jgi:hypothetical protein
VRIVEFVEVANDGAASGKRFSQQDKPIFLAPTVLAYADSASFWQIECHRTCEEESIVQRVPCVDRWVIWQICWIANASSIPDGPRDL